MRSTTALAGLAALVTVALIAIACGADGSRTDPGAEESIREIHIRMTDQLRFEPSEIHLQAGVPVLLVLDNSEAASVHDFTVRSIPVSGVKTGGEDADVGHVGMDNSRDYDLHIALESGQDGVLEFTPTEAGEYEFLCTVPGHATVGMTGKLVVT